MDANVIVEFSKNFIWNETSDTRMLVEAIIKGPGFAIDEGGKIRQQWLDTCCGNRKQSPFWEWFFQGLKEGYIKKVAADLKVQHKKFLRTKCGFPDDRYELTYIEVANLTSTRYVISEDIHFFEPKLKRAKATVKLKAKQSRKGCVCRYLHRTIDIMVGTVNQALQEIDLTPTQ